MEGVVWLPEQPVIEKFWNVTSHCCGRPSLATWYVGPCCDVLPQPF